MVAIIGRILTWPFRALFKLGQKPSVRTAKKSSAGLAATKVTQNQSIPQSDQFDSWEGQPVKTIFFKELPRPGLNEKSAADMTLEQAHSYVEQAERFYTYDFSLFARSDFFYEEIEQDYLDAALGKEHESIDARFLRVMTTFRKTLNRNTRNLFILYTPAFFTITLLAGLIILNAPEATMPALLADFTAGPVPWLGSAILASIVMLSGLGFLSLLYLWPYKVTQQRNLMGLDNYITSKFGRINQNFQVAKRRSLNVERNKRMNQAEELKEEAGIWALSYQWLAMRLLLCELTVRNKIYQIRRNTTLYGIGGVLVCIAIAVMLAIALLYSNITTTSPWVIIAQTASLTIAFLIGAFGLLMRDTTRDMLSSIQTEEWNRFNLINLHQTIADHVGEDKLQIVTFRDRNRME